MQGTSPAYKKNNSEKQSKTIHDHLLVGGGFGRAVGVGMVMGGPIKKTTTTYFSLGRPSERILMIGSVDENKEMARTEKLNTGVLFEQLIIISKIIVHYGQYNKKTNLWLKEN